jgi:nucleoid DNA-binding protein
MAKSAAAKPLTKSQVLAGIADATGLTKKQVQAVFDAMTDHIKGQLGKKGPGTFVIPGLIKLRLVKKPATKAREGINPKTGEKIMIKAKPATNVVRARVMKALKDLVV